MILGPVYDIYNAHTASLIPYTVISPYRVYIFHNRLQSVGLFSPTPNMVPRRRKMSITGFPEMEESCLLGAQQLFAA